MSQTLLVVVLFVAAMAALPWLVRRIQQKQASNGMAAGTASKVLSAIAVGPHQRVVTVEVGPEHARTCLVLGVTAQHITCLHIVGAPAASGVSGVSDVTPSFLQEMALAQTSAAASHG